MSYTLEFSNGLKLEDLTRNVDVYSSARELTREMFAGGMKRVKVVASSDDEEEAIDPRSGEYENCELLLCVKVGEEWQLAFRPVPHETLEHLKNRADLDYLLMITEEA